MLTNNPKQARGTGLSPTWFGYYAGYSSAFVEEALTYLDLAPGASVLDPWNGSGTTTDVADRRGFHGVGYDLNPAVVLVARARLLRSDVRPSHRSLGKEITRASSKLASADFLDEEPLCAWFAPQTAATLRGIERAIQRILMPEPYLRIAGKSSLEDVSPLAAYYYVAMFRTVRRLLEPFKTSNPTWTRFPESPRHRLRTSDDDVYAIFGEEVERMFAGMAEAPAVTTAARVDIGNSTAINALDRQSVDAVLSSPPYCTRIDYAVSMRPELAVLGMSAAEFRALRLSMLGCTLRDPKDAARSIPREWGTACAQLLEGIRHHPAHGSSTYYYPTHVAYFAGLYTSYAEIARVLRPGGRAILVVQDSYYKELHTDLQTITEEMFASLGLESSLRRDFSSKNTKAAVNTHRLKYRNTADATESVLVFDQTARN